MVNKVKDRIMTVAAIIMMVLTAISILAVLWRLLAKVVPFINGADFFWANESELLLLHWVVVFGMIVVFMKGSDIRITLLLDRFPLAIRSWAMRLFHVFDIIVFGVISFFGSKLVIQEWHTQTSSLGWSRGFFVYCPYVFLGAFVVVFSIYQLIISFRKGSKEVTGK